MEQSRHRGWAFTNFAQDADYVKLNAEYVVVGKEVCPTTGRAHDQGYVYWKNARTMSAVMNMLPKCHIEPAKGSAEENTKYCSKGGNVSVIGEMPRQGKRSDISGMKDMVKSGKGMRTITEDLDSYQAWRAGEMYLRYHEPKRKWKPEVFWYWGESGAGKTRQAIEEAGEDYWISGETLQWWNGYDAHENVIIDDFRQDQCGLVKFLKILDRNGFEVPCKGGARQLLAKKIWITSPYHPNDIYSTHEDMYQLRRRIDVIKQFGRDPNQIDTEETQRSGVIVTPT